MANGNTTGQLSAEDFAAKIKAKYPDYAHVPDQELTAKILEKYPEYREKVMAPGVAQARQEAAAPVAKADFIPQPTGEYRSMSPTGVLTTPKLSAKTQSEAIGGSLGFEAGAAFAGLRAGGAVLPKFVQMMARASATGVGVGAGAVASGSTPKEAVGEAAKGTAGAFGFETLGAGFHMLSRLWKADPARMIDLGDLISIEEKTRKSVQEAAPEIRKAISETYPEVSTPVRIMPAAKVAQQAESGMVAEAAPKQVSHLADIGRARQQQALRLLSKAAKIMQDSPEGASDEVKGILDKAKALQGIDFRDAQKLYSALGRAAAKGQGWKLSGEQIHALTQARDALEGSMKTALDFESGLERAAKSAGVMPEGELGEFYRFRDAQTGGSFSVRKSEYSPVKIAEEAAKLRRSIPETAQLDPLLQQKQAAVKERFDAWQPADKSAQWEAAQAKHRQFVEDFYKSGGALKPIMDAEPNERGEVLKHLLSDPKTRVRATQALQRYGFDTKDILRLAERWRDPTQLNRAIQDAARLEQVGQETFGRQEAATTRGRVGKEIVKRGAQAAGAGLLYELYKQMKPKSPNLIP